MPSENDDGLNEGNPVEAVVTVVVPKPGVAPKLRVEVVGAKLKLVVAEVPKEMKGIENG